jgi:hypothetical protein
MTKPMVRIHKIDTNEVIDREMTDDEYASWQLDRELYEAEKLKEAAHITERSALLSKLGITEDEARLLLS